MAGRPDFDAALLVLNDWLGQRVRLLVLVELEPSGKLPPSGPAEGWHVVLARQDQLRRPDLNLGPPKLSEREMDFMRGINVGTYELGDGPLKLLLDDLPCERVVTISEERQPPHKLAFYLPGSAVVLTLEQIQSE